MNEVLSAKNPIPGDAARFFWTALAAFPINMIVLLLVGQIELHFLVLDSALVAWLAGLVGLCIPVQHKAGFIIPGVFGGWLIFYAFAWILIRRGF